MIDAHTVEVVEHLVDPRGDEASDRPWLATRITVLPGVEHRIAPRLPARVRAARRCPQRVAVEEEGPVSPDVAQRHADGHVAVERETEPAARGAQARVLTVGKVLEVHVAIDAPSMCACCEQGLRGRNGAGGTEELHHTAVRPAPEILLAIGLGERLVEGITREPRPVGFPKTRQRLALRVTRLRAKRGEGFGEGGTMRGDSVSVLRAHWCPLPASAHETRERLGPEEPLLDKTIQSDRQGAAGKDGAVVGRGVAPGRFALGPELHGVEAKRAHEAQQAQPRRGVWRATSGIRSWQRWEARILEGKHEDADAEPVEGRADMLAV